MRAPLSWLRDYAPFDAPVADLAVTLSELGLVVEGVEHVGAGLGDVVVSRILGIRPHPNADRVRLVDVDIGGGQATQIVCGAWNFSAGDLVPLAPDGAMLPDGKIKRRQMQGEWSNGMLCSPSELRLPEPAGAADGLLILPADIAPPGTPLVEALGLEPDVVFDLEVSPNRPDALCMAGVARDLAAALGETSDPPWAASPTLPIDESLGAPPITVEAGDLCPRFAGIILSGVPTGPSPAWMARRLTLAGMRPINAVVDVSNYVMLDMGQPNHAYDLERLGGGGILVRRGRPGEVIETLDGVSRTVGPEDCVICDATGAAGGIAGIMGGSGSEIGPATRTVLLEAAWFSPTAIARTGKRLGLQSEARVRFERGVDPELAPAAVDRFASLLAAIDPEVRRGPLADVKDAESMPMAPVIRLRTARVNSVLGTALTDSDVERLLTPIGFSVVPGVTGSRTSGVTGSRTSGVTGSRTSGVTGVHEVHVPSWRLECDREIDLVEEVARMWGYRRITPTLPSGVRGEASASAGLTARQKERRRIRQVLTGAGFDEAWTTTFLAPGDLQRAGLPADAVEVENPLDRSESILRTSLLPGLLKAVKFNVDRQAPVVCLFETGNVFFLPAADSSQVTPDESEHLGVIAWLGSETRNDQAAAAVVELWMWLSEALRLPATRLREAKAPAAMWHRARASEIVGPSGLLGGAGEVDPGVVEAYGLAGRIAYLTASLDALEATPREPRRARDVSRYPASDVDLAFVVADNVEALAVRDTLSEASGEIVESVTLFDVYRGEQVGAGRRSLAFRLRFRAFDHTLEETELAGLRQRAIDAVRTSFGAELRA